MKGEIQERISGGIGVRIKIVLRFQTGEKDCTLYGKMV